MASNYQMIPSDKLYPPPSILEKLAQFDQDAPKVIFAASDEIQRQRFRINMHLDELKKPFLKFIADLFNQSSSFPIRDSLLTEWQSKNYYDAHVGNNLRRAIQEYCEKNPEIAEKAQLTEEEKECLKTIPLWTSALKAQKISYLPKNVRAEVVERLDLNMSV